MGLPSIKKAENFTHNQAGNIAEEIFLKKNIRTGGRGVRRNINFVNEMAVALLNTQQLWQLVLDWAHQYLVTEQGKAHKALPLPEKLYI